MPDAIMVIDIGPDGAVATHPPRVELPVKVAPVEEALKATKFNTIRPHLVTIACKSLPNHHFKFDSSFLDSSKVVRNGFTKFARLMQALQKQDPSNLGQFPPVSVFGHADPTGGDNYNKVLSGRRARTVYGLLTRKAEMWDQLFTNAEGTGDHWGIHSIESMLEAVGRSDTPTAVAASPAKRKDLFLQYMDFLCRDDSGQPFQLNAETDFVARGKSKGLKGDVQGCSDFNPVFLLSKEEEDGFKKDKDLQEVRNRLYAPDRRVIIYVFEHGTQINPDKWPCPTTAENPEKCRHRFWSDAKDRLKRDPTHQRAFLRLADPLDTEDHPPIFFTTMACRFYHAFAEHSPCEVGVRLWVVRLRINSGKHVVPLKNVRYVVKAGSADYAPVVRGKTDENGEIRIPLFDEKTTMTLKVDTFGAGDSEANGSAKASGEGSQPPPDGVDPDAFPGEDSFQIFTLDAGALAKMSGEDLPLQQRLYNLGLSNVAPGKFTLQEQTRAFQAYKKSRKLDQADDQTVRDNIQIEHEIADKPAPPPDNDDDGGDSSAT